MAYEHEDMTGSLFRNKKPKNDKSPHHMGTAKIFGKKIGIAGWVRETKDGTKYFSFRFSEEKGTQGEGNTF